MPPYAGCYVIMNKTILINRKYILSVYKNKLYVNFRDIIQLFTIIPLLDVYSEIYDEFIEAR